MPNYQIVYQAWLLKVRVKTTTMEIIYPFKKIYLCLLFLWAAGIVRAQSFPGYRTSNYSGVNGVFFNPANIADSKYKWDINLISVDGFVGNNQNSLKFKDIAKSSFNADSLKSKLLKGNDANLRSLIRTDILGPSFMFNAGDNTAIAITTRARIFGNARDLNGRFARAVIDGGVANDSYPFSFNEPQSIVHAAGWGELGLSLGQVFTKRNSPHFFKAGITIKYLAGVADSYLRQGNVNGTVNTGANGVYLTDATGSISLNTTDANFSDYKFNDFFKFNGHGLGGDIGFVYEYRGTDKTDYSKYVTDRFANKYKVRVGVAVLDIGEIKFNKDNNQSAGYDVNIPAGQEFLLSQFAGKSISEYKAILDNSPYFTQTGGNNDSYTIELPTTLQATVDYNINNGFYLNAGAQAAFTRKKGLNLYSYDSYTLTPRWENSRFGVAIPFNYNRLSHFNAGISLRAGPFFIGSGSVFTALFDKSKQADLHVGLRFGMPYAKKEKPDTDKDGVYDDKDKCPSVAGVARYEGCPIPDTDADGVNDEEDSCRTVAGLLKYHGCPVPDKDGDGVNDELDKCPDTPGSGQFQGCPDTDGDGIADPDDQCPTVAGVSKYQGCPVPDKDGDGVNDDEDVCPDEAGPASSKGCPVEKVVLNITADFKNILFDFGKATIRSESADILANAAKIMNEQIPNSSFYVDGYTDNIGSVATNKRLSKARAQAVANALVAGGVDKARIIARGFGKDNPVCDNKTDEGRQCNRRVEVIIRNVNQQKDSDTERPKK